MCKSKVKSQKSKVISDEKIRSSAPFKGIKKSTTVFQATDFI